MSEKTTPAKGSRKRRERGSISSEEILRGAFAVARRDSVDNLSMPELARHLDVGVTSIYWYFRRKEDLLKAMTEEAIHTVQSELPTPSDASEWRPFLAAYFRRMRDVYRQDSTLCDLVLVRTSSYSLNAGVAIYQDVEKILALMSAAGFTLESAMSIHSTLSVYTRGTVISERIQQSGNSVTLDPVAQSKLVDPTTMPNLSTLVASHSLSMVSDEDFEFSLAFILDGAERILEVEAPASTPSSSLTPFDVF